MASPVVAARHREKQSLTCNAFQVIGERLKSHSPITFIFQCLLPQQAGNRNNLFRAINDPALSVVFSDKVVTDKTMMPLLSAIPLFITGNSPITSARRHSECYRHLAFGLCGNGITYHWV